MSVCNELDSWLVKNGADLTVSELVDSAISGCMIYCEPPNAKSNAMIMLRKMQTDEERYGCQF